MSLRWSDDREIKEFSEVKEITLNSLNSLNSLSSRRDDPITNSSLLITRCFTPEFWRFTADVLRYSKKNIIFAVRKVSNTIKQKKTI